MDEVKKLCTSLRRNAKEERVLFHYNGHGVPRPTVNGEIWVFNKVSVTPATAPDLLAPSQPSAGTCRVGRPERVPWAQGQALGLPSAGSLWRACGRESHSCDGRAVQTLSFWVTFGELYC